MVKTCTRANQVVFSMILATIGALASMLGYAMRKEAYTVERNDFSVFFKKRVEFYSTFVKALTPALQMGHFSRGAPSTVFPQTSQT